MPVEKNLQEIIDVVAGGVTTGIDALADGFQIWEDMPKFIPVLSQIPAAVKDADHALNYLQDMTEEKEEEVIAAVTVKLNDTSDKVKEGARRVLRLIAEFYMTIKFFAKKDTGTTDQPASNG